MGKTRVEYLPQVTHAPVVQWRADAGAKKKAGQVEPACLDLLVAAALVGDLDEGVEQRADRGGGPLVAAVVEQLLQFFDELLRIVGAGFAAKTLP